MSWSSIEERVLARAAGRAPSARHARPWTLRTSGESAELLAGRAPARELFVSCGAALVSLELAVRALGRVCSTVTFPREAPDVVARVVATGRREATEAEFERYAAVYRRRSHRAPFSSVPVPPELRAVLARAGAAPGTQVWAVRDRPGAATLAGVLGDAGTALRNDAVFWRELAPWSRFPEPGGTIAPDALLGHEALTERLLDDGPLVIVTRGDTREDRLRAGVAVQRVWLTAVLSGLTGSLLTRPLDLRDVRAALANRLDLPGCPQAMLRFGHALAAPRAEPVAAAAPTA